METAVHISSGPIQLHGMLNDHPSPKGSVLICHPHPLMGGNMDNPVVQTIAQAAFESNYTTLRFNFRGTGKSTGTHDEGRGEQDDVISCLDFLGNRIAGPVILAGYSFGSWVNAHVLDQGIEVADHIMVSPPTAFLSFSAVSSLSSTGFVITGEYDEFAPPAQVQALMDRCAVSCKLALIKNGDHFYSTSLGELKTRIMDYL